ncbi:right-handed parallel beta-helix repeat-containing protein [Corynebacterium nasicanis]|uniref:Right-handed parallel beta-helix repeat-containing protein n=1 Tax=Corynebacterium nasicanis TaxID=1448267 RepID=A0ABW1QFY1_9CORY
MIRTWRAVAVLVSAMLLAGCGVAFTKGPVTYYVSADGDDDASGLRPERAWASLERATEQELAPGETIVLTGDRPLPGTLRVTSEDAGAPELPVRITADESFPGIVAEGKAGIDIVDTSGVEVSGVDIIVEGDAPVDGVLVTVSPGGGRHSAITLRDLAIDGAYQGVAVGAERAGDGFDGVTIEAVHVTGAQRNGIITYGATAPDYALSDLRIRDSVVTGTRGIEREEVNTGSGIVIGSVDGAVVERNDTSRNGAESHAPEGPIGLWTHDSTDVIIRDNTSHHNRSGWTDGGGFGVDISATDVLVERNLSHDNHGAGFLVYTHGKGTPTGRVTFRYNASVGDGHTDQLPSGFAVLGGLDTDDPDVFVHDIHLHHNTVVTRGGDGAGASALLLMGTVRNLRVHHNILDTSAGSAPAVRIRSFDAAGQLEFAANQLAVSPQVPLLDWDGGLAHDIDEVSGFLPGAGHNVARAPDFLDRDDLPNGLAVHSPLRVAFPPTTDLRVEPATGDLLGRPIAGGEDSVGAVSPRD